MELYANKSGESNVKKYELKPDGIIVRFINNEVYEYNYQRTGKKHVENMKQMAQAGEGLGTYISVVTKYGYNRQLRWNTE